MRVVNKDEFVYGKYRFMREINQGAIFVHPTDTIYGLGCDARNTSAVRKLRVLKNRYTKPFSVIAPSKEWILEHCIVDPIAEDWLNRLPGPYTLILKLKKGNGVAISPEANPDMDTIGIRIPKHWISKVAEELEMPIVTTSANKIGQEFMTSLEDIDGDLKQSVDFIIYEGEKQGRPSTIVDLTQRKIITR